MVILSPEDAARRYLTLYDGDIARDGHLEALGDNETEPSRAAQKFAREYEDQASPEDFARYLEVLDQLLKEGGNSASGNPQ
ncbi:MULTISPECIES: hypothetical protein [Microvirga]|uniref:hypothetical protein n=1 Tax=Microvirga TaxID=186650 RepID=UPI0021C98FA4|nr:MULTISPECIES: hypothetical protein [unclassified Microvirga]MDG2570962.1 hypothetical protein [Vibrio parahaemolyticus]